MKSDLYAKVTDQIVAQLEAGVVPWTKPWTTRSSTITVSDGISSIWPRNYVTKNSYSGINVVLCWLTAQEFGFADSRWLTYNQAKKIGAQVRGGEKGLTLYYADRFLPKKDRAEAAKTGGKVRPVFFLKAFTVFNVAQIDGLPTEDTAAAPVAAPVVVAGPISTPEIDAATAIVIATNATIYHGGDRAYYVPSQDIIQQPHLASFPDALDYYRTLFHELSHWTGHKSRLDRDLTGSSSTETYAFEELVAELGAAFVSAQVGIQPTTRHADYLASWIKHLKNDKHAIFKAASAATKAADWVLGKKAPARSQEGQDGPQEVAAAA